MLVELCKQRQKEAGVADVQTLVGGLWMDIALSLCFMLCLLFLLVAAAQHLESC